MTAETPGDSSGSRLVRNIRWRLLGRHFHSRRFLNALLAGWTAVIAVVLSGLSTGLDLRILDLRLRLRALLIQDDVPVRVALLGASDMMDDQGYQQRSLDLLQRVGPDGPDVHRRPAVVAFTSPMLRPLGGPELVAGLVSATAAAAPVVHSYVWTEAEHGSIDDTQLRSVSFPLPEGAGTLRRADAVRVPATPPLDGLLASSSAIGFTNLEPDDELGGVVRSLPLVVRFRDRVYPSVALAGVMALLHVKPAQVEIRVGSAVTLSPSGQAPLRIPIDARGDTYLYFRPTLGSAHDTQRALFHHAPPREAVVSAEAPAEMVRALDLRERLLFVGDPRIRVRTPLASDVPLVNLQAQLASDILTGNHLIRAPFWLDITLALLSVFVLAFYLGRNDPQGLGGIWAALSIGALHGGVAYLAFLVGPWWMAVALAGDSLFFAALVDGIYLHGYLKRAVGRLKDELDHWEKEETAYLDLMGREETEQTERLELLQAEEALARSILDRQEALIAQKMPVRATGERAALTLTNGAEDDDPAMEGEGGAEPGLRRRHILDPSLAGRQPQVIRELSGRYRAQVARHEALLSRYRQLLDQVLAELEAQRTRQPVPLESIEAAADELVASTGVLTRDPQMLRILAQIVGRIGPNDRATVLIHGESGTGKELVARAIHRHSPRRGGPFVALNCGAFPEGLIESELFGHVRGAFSGAARDRRGAFLSAQGGVLFLDEIGDAPPFIQVKLLRALQERSIRPVGADADIAVDVRIVAATHIDLRAAVRAGRFREDLYHRLHVIPLELPPLRARTADIPLLSRRFLEREAAAAGVPPRALSEGALSRLCAHTWPGNVRELENGIVALNAMVTESVIDERHVAQVLGLASDVVTAGVPRESFSTSDLRWLEAFRRHRFSIVHAVADPDAPARNRQTGYRRLVGLSCKALYLTNWQPESAAELLAGDAPGAAKGKALAKVHTYLRTLEQAIEGKDPGKFESDWRRFLGDDYFFVKATLEAVRVGKVRARAGLEVEEADA